MALLIRSAARSGRRNVALSAPASAPVRAFYIGPSAAKAIAEDRALGKHVAWKLLASGHHSPEIIETLTSCCHCREDVADLWAAYQLSRARGAPRFSLYATKTVLLAAARVGALDVGMEMAASAVKAHGAGERTASSLQLPLLRMCTTAEEALAAVSLVRGDSAATKDPSWLAAACVEAGRGDIAAAVLSNSPSVDAATKYALVSRLLLSPASSVSSSVGTEGGTEGVYGSDTSDAAAREKGWGQRVFTALSKLWANARASDGDAGVTSEGSIRDHAVPLLAQVCCSAGKAGDGDKTAVVCCAQRYAAESSAGSVVHPSLRAACMQCTAHRLSTSDSSAWQSTAQQGHAAVLVTPVETQIAASSNATAAPAGDATAVPPPSSSSSSSSSCCPGLSLSDPFLLSSRAVYQAGMRLAILQASRRVPSSPPGSTLPESIAAVLALQQAGSAKGFSLDPPTFVSLCLLLETCAALPSSQPAVLPTHSSKHSPEKSDQQQHPSPLAAQAGLSLVHAYARERGARPWALEAEAAFLLSPAVKAAADAGLGLVFPPSLLSAALGSPSEEAVEEQKKGWALPRKAVAVGSPAGADAAGRNQAPRPLPWVVARLLAATRPAVTLPPDVDPSVATLASASVGGNGNGNGNEEVLRSAYGDTSFAVLVDMTNSTSTASAAAAPSYQPTPPPSGQTPEALAGELIKSPVPALGSLQSLSHSPPLYWEGHLPPKLRGASVASGATVEVFDELVLGADAPEGRKAVFSSPTSSSSTASAADAAAVAAAAASSTELVELQLDVRARLQMRGAVAQDAGSKWPGKVLCSPRSPFSLAADSTLQGLLRQLGRGSNGNGSVTCIPASAVSELLRHARVGGEASNQSSSKGSTSTHKSAWLEAISQQVKVLQGERDAVRRAPRG